MNNDESDKTMIISYPNNSNHNQREEYTNPEYRNYNNGFQNNVKNSASKFSKIVMSAGLICIALFLAIMATMWSSNSNSNAPEPAPSSSTTQEVMPPPEGPYESNNPTSSADSNAIKEQELGKKAADGLKNLKDTGENFVKGFQEQYNKNNK